MEIKNKRYIYFIFYLIGLAADGLTNWKWAIWLTDFN